MHNLKAEMRSLSGPGASASLEDELTSTLTDAILPSVANFAASVEAYMCTYVTISHA